MCSVALLYIAGDSVGGDSSGTNGSGADGAGPSSAGDGGEGKAGAEEGENANAATKVEEEESDLKLSWEVLELARLICQK